MLSNLRNNRVISAMSSAFIPVALVCALSLQNAQCQSAAGSNAEVVSIEFTNVNTSSPGNGSFDVEALLTDHITLEKDFSSACSSLNSSDANRRRSAVNNAISQFISAVQIDMDAGCTLAVGALRTIKDSRYQCPATPTNISSSATYKGAQKLTLTCPPKGVECVECDRGSAGCVEKNKALAWVSTTHKAEDSGRGVVDDGFAAIRDLRGFLSENIAQVRDMARKDLAMNLEKDCEWYRTIGGESTLKCTLLGTGYETAVMADKISPRYVESNASAYGFVRTDYIQTTYCLQGQGGTN